MANKYSKRLALVITVVILNYIVDRITKVLAGQYLEGKDQISMLYNTIILKYLKNNGAFLSLGSNWEHSLKLFIFIILPLIACVLAILFCLFKDLGRLRTILIVSIATGGIGNIQDRIFNQGSVIDFLNFGIGNFRTGVLNVADMSITFGVIILLISELVRGYREKEEDSTPADV